MTNWHVVDGFDTSKAWISILIYEDIVICFYSQVTLFMVIKKILWDLAAHKLLKDKNNQGKYV